MKEQTAINIKKGISYVLMAPTVGILLIWLLSSIVWFLNFLDYNRPMASLVIVFFLLAGAGGFMRNSVKKEQEVLNRAIFERADSPAPDWDPSRDPADDEDSKRGA